VATFLKGALIFFPGFLAMLITRRIFGFAYEGFPLYMSLALRDHLVPLLVAAGGFLLLQRRLDFPATEEGIFLAAFPYFSGFFALLNITDMVGRWGKWDSHALILLPLTRIVEIVLVSLSAPRFYRWTNAEGWAFCGIVGLIGAVFSVGSFLFRISFPEWSAVFVGVAFLAALLLLAFRFPRVLRG
jgi:hypothetical protein